MKYKLHEEISSLRFRRYSVYWHTVIRTPTVPYNCITNTVIANSTPYEYVHGTSTPSYTVIDTAQYTVYRNTVQYAVYVTHPGCLMRRC